MAFPFHRSTGQPVLVGTILFALASIAPLPASAQVPPEFHGSWGQSCSDPAAPRILLEPDSITVTSSGERHSYAGVIASHTWYGGVSASGDRLWLPTSKEPDSPFAFVVAPPPYGTQGAMTLEEGHPEHGREVRHLFGSEFHRCPAG